MKVLHCIASMDPSYGGPVKVVKGLCRASVALGVEPSVFTSSSGDRLRDENNVRSFPHAGIQWLRPLIRRYYWDPFLPFTIKGRLKSFDILHIHGVFNGLVSAACRAARASKVPYVLEPFGTLSPYCLKKSSWLKKIALLAGERGNIEGADAVCFTSEAEREKAALNFRIPGGFVAPNGLSRDEFAHLPQKGPYRKSLGLDPDDGIFLFIGRLQPIKGLEIFLPAFLRWRASQSRRWRAVLVGPDEGGYREKLETLVRQEGGGDCVRFTGPLYGTARLGALAEADVVFLTSYHENFGIAAAEGMACGKPVLVSEMMDMAGAVREKNIGEVAVLTVEGITEALERMVSRQKDWTQMGQRAKEWAIENCDWDRASRIIVAQYQRILSKRGQRPFPSEKEEKGAVPFSQ